MSTSTDTAGTATASRYSWGGDEHLVVQVSEEMSLEANFSVMAVTELLRRRAFDGVLDICPANASFLVRFDHDVPGDAPAGVVEGPAALVRETSVQGAARRHPADRA